MMDPAPRLSESDRRILDHLRRDARMPTAELARRVGLARTTVQTKIARLMDRGVIEGFSVRTGPATDPQEVSAFVLVQAEPGFGARGATRLAALPGVRALSETCGEYGFVAELAAPDLPALNAAIDAIGAVAGVRRTQTHVVLARRRAGG